MQLHEVKEVKSVTSYNSANEALSQGWTLIAVVSESSGGPCYVLGKRKVPNEAGAIGVMVPERMRRPSGQAEGSDD
jgi:hypothetical protein